MKRENKIKSTINNLDIHGSRCVKCNGPHKVKHNIKWYGIVRQISKLTPKIRDQERKTLYAFFQMYQLQE